MKTKPFTFLRALTFLFLFSGFYAVIAEAHRSGCHRWHSCPSDSGSYICGDIGYCSGCPDNQFCEGGQPVSRSLEPNKSNESFESYIKENSLNNFTPNKAIKYREADYVDYACPKMNGVIEFSLDDGSRVDCETDTHSIEFDFGKKWAEAIGQALYYSSKTGKQPGIFLIIAEKRDWNNLEKIKRVIKTQGMDVKIWTISPEDLKN
tara:strand:- start:34 stop:651 length:618 start_codon:yes stop_codon:yes gene_type:complete